MKNVKVLVTIVILIQTITMFGQLERQNGLSITIKGPNTRIDGVTPEDASGKTQHLRFLTEEYIEAKITGLDDTFYLRFNIIADEMEFIKDGKIYFLSKKENQEIHFTKLNRNFKVINVNDEFQYFEINFKGKASLYTKQQVVFKKGKVAQNQFESAKKSKFIQKKDTYYLKVNNDELIKLPKSKNDFYAVFGENSKKIKTFIKKEKLNRKEITDVIKVVKYYNTL